MSTVQVVNVGTVSSREFKGSCWNCSSQLSLESTSKTPLETVKCPICSKIAELQPEKEMAYHEPSVFDWVFRRGKPKRLSDEY